MCVIMWCTDKKPTQQMIEKGWDRNYQGFGAAWREGDEVVWEKGLMEFDEAEAIIDEVPLPAVFHFRRASVGGVCPELTHPFEVSGATGLELTGRTKNYVLFHNGDWKEWEATVKTCSLLANKALPRGGKWSDSRALAWLCAGPYGLNFMDFIGASRGIAFGPNDAEMFWGNGWHKINDVFCSNDLFMKDGRVRADWHNKCCLYGNCGNHLDLDKDTRCPIHPKSLDPKTETYDEKRARVAQAIGLAKEKTGSEVSTASPIPFQPANPGSFPHNQRPVISVALAERWYSEGRPEMSKKKLKKIKEAYEWLRSPDQKRRVKAMERLRELTDAVVKPA